MSVKRKDVKIRKHRKKKKLRDLLQREIMERSPLRPIELLTDFNLKKIEEAALVSDFDGIKEILNREITTTKYGLLLSTFFDEIAEGIINTLVDGQDFDFRGLGSFERRLNKRYNTISVKFTPNKSFKERLQVLQTKNLEAVEKQKVIIKKALKVRMGTDKE